MLNENIVQHLLKVGFPAFAVIENVELPRKFVQLLAFVLGFYQVVKPIEVIITLTNANNWHFIEHNFSNVLLNSGKLTLL